MAKVKYRDLVQEYPYEAVMKHTGLSREEIETELDKILANLSPENKQRMKDAEEFLDMEVEMPDTLAVSKELLRQIEAILAEARRLKSADHFLFVGFHPQQIRDAHDSLKRILKL